MLEKRRYQRLPSAIPCLWQSKNGEHTGEILDFSFGGACLGKSSKLPKEGTDVMLVLFPGTQDVRLWGQVIYSSENHMGRPRSGIEFMGSHQEGIEKLMPLLNCYIDDRD
jgi:hypothetical protein